MHDVDKWGYDQEYDPEEYDPHCLCGLSVKHWAAYCGPSCELADEEGTVDADFANELCDIPYVLYRVYPFSGGNEVSNE